MPVPEAPAANPYRKNPAGVGSTGAIRLTGDEMDAMLAGGARWAVERGWGWPEDLERIEERGQMLHAKPGNVSERAKRRQRDDQTAARRGISRRHARRDQLRARQPPDHHPPGARGVRADHSQGASAAAL